jgi:Skp family chaperone for outer membrane proteins
MKKVFACLVFVGLVITSPLAYAQAIKIGYFDGERVFAESKRCAKEREAYDKKEKEWQQSLEKKTAEVKALEESLRKKAGMLSEQARKAMERDYQQKAIELDRIKQDAGDELKPMYQTMMGRFSKNIRMVLKKLGQEEKYTIILEAGLVLYASKEIDITDQVIKAFDAAKE